MQLLHTPRNLSPTSFPIIVLNSPFHPPWNNTLLDRRQDEISTNPPSYYSPSTTLHPEATVDPNHLEDVATWKRGRVEAWKSLREQGWCWGRIRSNVIGGCPLSRIFFFRCATRLPVHLVTYRLSPFATFRFSSIQPSLSLFFSFSLEGLWHGDYCTRYFLRKLLDQILGKDFGKWSIVDIFRGYKK